MRAVFIQGQSQYGATRLFIDEMVAAFRRRGYATKVIDIMAESDPGVAMAIAAGTETDLVYTVGILGEYRDAQGRGIGQIFNAPHVIQYVDYPFSHLVRLQGTPRQAALLAVDHSHVEAVRATFGGDHFAFVGFCPHAAAGEPVEPDPDPESFAAERPLPILFAGSFYGVEPLPWKDEGAGIRGVFDHALEIAMSAEFMPALEAVDQVLRGMGQDPLDPRYVQLRRYSTWVHEEVRMRRRLRLLEAASKAGLPVFCVGSGYEGWIEAHKSFRLASAMSLTDTAALMRRARVVLNANANFGRGSHERPLTAMLAGAAVASDHSTWWAEQFVEDEDMLLYRWRDLDAGLARLAALAEDPEAAWRMGRKAQAKAAAAHRFDNRVDTVIAAAVAARGHLCDPSPQQPRITAFSH
ncbi:glycosyltransferase [Caulobacter sp. X]|uniref:glycosyltransferase family protein n=1 Tax=Caulobacter sp. X TaxID=2048901 RepID=UPI000C15E019|nr:glycosyltransferase [Caulobacter sp. X]PIB95905.1 hypothetical protein CSW60_15145 [Caulobacter sp. X]